MAAKPDELTAIIHEIRDRVKARHPEGAIMGDISLPDLMPLLHARDAAEGKVASIGSVNPRPPGLVNSIVQSIKRTVARALDWHVREQIEFNRGVMNCVEATLEALTESKRALSIMASRLEDTRDLRVHWIQWREEWERNLSSTQIQFLRSLSDLQGAWQHRVTLLDETHRDQMKALHADFEKTLWVDLLKIRQEYDALIHSELRLLRQRTSIMKAGAEVVAQVAAVSDGTVPIDWMKFAERFRGSEQYVRRHLQIYVDRFQGATNVLDIGCGRGEMLEIFREAGMPARGIELSHDCVALCREKGLDVEYADLFSYLASLNDNSLAGIVCLQVVEHLPPARVPEFIALAHGKLRPGALLAVETPNPECLAIFATHFYLDPTHAKPLPPALMSFYLEEAGFGGLEIVRLERAIESMPELTQMPSDFREKFFGALDYAVFGRRL